MGIRIVPPHPTPDLRDQAEKLLTEAFDAGYKHAYGEIREHLSRADLSALLLSQIKGAPVQLGEATVVTAPKPGNGAALPPTYGLLTATVRGVMTKAPKSGLIFAHVHKRANESGVAMTTGQVREALRRLSESGHVRCKGRRWWMATDKLRGVAANENGAPEGAPDAGKGVAPQA